MWFQLDFCIKAVWIGSKIWLYKWAAMMDSFWSRFHDTLCHTRRISHSSQMLIWPGCKQQLKLFISLAYIEGTATPLVYGGFRTNKKIFYNVNVPSFLLWNSGCSKISVVISFWILPLPVVKKILNFPVVQYSNFYNDVPLRTINILLYPLASHKMYYTNCTVLYIILSLSFWNLVLYMSKFTVFRK